MSNNNKTPKEDAVERAKATLEKLHKMRDSDPGFNYGETVEKLVADCNKVLESTKKQLKRAMDEAIKDLEFGRDANWVARELSREICSHEREYAFVSTFLQDVQDEKDEEERKERTAAHREVLKRQREFLEGRKKPDGKLTFRQLIESVEAFSDQDCHPNIVASTLDDCWWGVHEISFKDGVLSIRGYDDEGDECGDIAKEMRKLVPEDMLDKPALVKVGTDDWKNKTDGVLDQYDKPVKACSVKDSIVTFYDEGEEGQDQDGSEDDGEPYFCKWSIVLG